MRTQQPVVFMYVLCERLVPRIPGRRLETTAAGTIHVDDLCDELDVEPVGELPATVTPIGRFGMQLVIDVHGEQRLAMGITGGRQCGGEYRRIQPATQGDYVTFGFIRA